MNKRLLAIFLVMAMIFTVVLGGCSKTTKDPTDSAGTPKDPGEESVFNWNIGADPKTIDPVLNGASDGGNVINQTFEGLTREKSGIVYPGIATDWEIS